MEGETDNCASLTKDEKESNCFIYTYLGKQIYPIRRLSEWKNDGIEKILMGRD